MGPCYSKRWARMQAEKGEGATKLESSGDEMAVGTKLETLIIDEMVKRGRPKKWGSDAERKAAWKKGQRGA